MWPFSSSIARLQNSLTQFMSWVTSTIALAALTSSITRAFDFSRNDLVAGREDLVEQQDVRVHRGRDAKPEPGAHARRVGLDRRVDEHADVGELDDARRSGASIACGHAHERARQPDVVAAGQVLVETRRRARAARDVAATSITPADGVMIPASTWSRVLLPAPLGPMTASDSPWTDAGSHHLPQRPEIGRPARATGRFTNECRSVVLLVNRRLYWTPRSRTSIATQEPSSDGGRHGCAHTSSSVHHRTFANAGSSALEHDRREREEHERASRTRRAAVQSGSRPS